MLATVATARLPLRIRFGVAVLALIALLLVGGATAVLQVGAGALQITAGASRAARRRRGPGSGWS